MDKNLLLVKMIEKFPCLYKTDSMEYSRRDFTDRAWNEVSKELDLSVSECKEKWKNLRYGYLRSLRPTRDGTSKKKYYMHDEMEFITPYARTSLLKVREKIPNYNEGNSDKEDHLNENNFENDQFDVSFIEENCIDGLEGGGRHDHETNKVTLQEDPRRMFLLSLLPEIADFSERDMKIFRRRVFGLLDEINHNNSHTIKTESLYTF